MSDPWGPAPPGANNSHSRRQSAPNPDALMAALLGSGRKPATNPVPSIQPTSQPMGVAPRGRGGPIRGRGRGRGRGGVARGGAILNPPSRPIPTSTFPSNLPQKTNHNTVNTSSPRIGGHVGASAPARVPVQPTFSPGYDPSSTGRPVIQQERAVQMPRNTVPAAPVASQAQMPGKAAFPATTPPPPPPSTLKKKKKKKQVPKTTASSTGASVSPSAVALPGSDGSEMDLNSSATGTQLRGGAVAGRGRGGKVRAPRGGKGSGRGGRSVVIFQSPSVIGSGASAPSKAVFPVGDTHSPENGGGANATVLPARGGKTVRGRGAKAVGPARVAPGPVSTAPAVKPKKNKKIVTWDFEKNPYGYGGEPVPDTIAVDLKAELPTAADEAPEELKADFAQSIAHVQLTHQSPELMAMVDKIYGTVADVNKDLHESTLMHVRRKCVQVWGPVRAGRGPVLMFEKKLDVDRPVVSAVHCPKAKALMLLTAKGEDGSKPKLIALSTLFGEHPWSKTVRSDEKADLQAEEVVSKLMDEVFGSVLGHIQGPVPGDEDAAVPEETDPVATLIDSVIDAVINGPSEENESPDLEGKVVLGGIVSKRSLPHLPEVEKEGEEGEEADVDLSDGGNTPTLTVKVGIEVMDNGDVKLTLAPSLEMFTDHRAAFRPEAAEWGLFLQPVAEMEFDADSISLIHTFRPMLFADVMLTVNRGQASVWNVDLRASLQRSLSKPSLGWTLRPEGPEVSHVNPQNTNRKRSGAVVGYEDGEMRAFMFDGASKKPKEQYECVLPAGDGVTGHSDRIVGTQYMLRHELKRNLGLALLSVSENGELCLWELGPRPTGTLIHSEKLEGYGKVFGMQGLPRYGRRVAVSTEKGLVLVEVVIATLPLRVRDLQLRVTPWSLFCGATGDSVEYMRATATPSCLLSIQTSEYREVQFVFSW